MVPTRRILVLTVFVLSGLLLASGHVGSRPASPAEYESEGQRFRVETLTNRNDVVWGFDFLPGGRIIFTERSGRLALLDSTTGSVRPVGSAPKVAQAGQGGLLDVRVHPKFAETGWIYLTYSEPAGDKMTTALGRGKLAGEELEDYRKLFSAHEPNDNEIHFGSRLEFDGAGHVYMTVGDRNERHNAQSLAYHTGKILRLDEDGKPAAGNPFAGQSGAQPEIWSYGHRNPQGLTKNPATGDLWEAEFGPRGGDEINLIKAKANYGWPVVTYGREYYGPSIGEGTEKPGMESPAAYFVPSISPSGLAFYAGGGFPRWNGNLFVASLGERHLRRLVLDEKRVAKQEELLKDLGWRFRQVRQGPDGLLYFSTDEGVIGRLVPVSAGQAQSVAP